jgi:DNA-K related protein/Hsp70 protein
MARYLVGIDLGTTNSALAYIDLNAKPRTGHLGLKTFAIPQLVAAGQVGERELLPSFLYLPGAHDLPPGSAALPWNPDPGFVVGEFARNHGARIPGRLVSSAKSWLSNPQVDRTSPMLPWGAPPDVPRLSPVEVSARYLRHMVDAWNHAHENNPTEVLEEQTVVLTVPASFDDVARNLTAEAARQAGLKHVTLLEEPQAAFYCWLGLSAVAEVARMKPGMRCLVVDVGGGTSDFSLIRAGEEKGELTFQREAIGDHLLLGGDNMDLALARIAEAKLPQAGRLDAAQFGMLVQACRQAKETLLAPNPPATHSVTIMGRGRAVIGGSLHTSITPQDVRAAVFDGFFPRVSPDAEPERSARTGLQEMGLPYVSDPAVTRHLAAFLRKHIPAGQGGTPDAILFNGGVFQPQPLRDHLLEVMHPWYDLPARPWKPLVLGTPSLDLAVAWGAAYYAWLRHSGGKRIGGGIPRSYYIAIETDGERGTTERGTRNAERGTEEVARGTRNGESEALSVEGAAEEVDRSAFRVPRSAFLCVVPRGLEEGHEVTIPKPELELALGRPVLFPLYSSTVRGDDKPGQLLHIAPEQLLHLPPLHTILRGGKRAGAKLVPVTLSARTTEIGTLELYCVAKSGENRWRLEFNVRDIVRDDARSEERPEDGEQAVKDVFPEAQIEAAAELIRKTYLDQGLDAPSPKELTKALETALESSRENWPTGLCRRLWDFFEEVANERMRSGQHVNRWYNLVGFCLRPGFGDALDRYRIETLWKLLAGPTTGPNVLAREGGADHWIMWRRVSGGLNNSYQQTLFNRLRPVLLPVKGRNVPKPGANEYIEMWRCAASLERLDAKTKQALGDAVVRQLQRSPVAAYGFWALTRLGARVLLYGPLNSVLHPSVVEGWLDQISSFTPTNDSDRNGWAFCLSQLARRTGQRALDVDESRRASVLTVLRSLKVPPGWVRDVEEVVEMVAAERSQLFGESLPIGLRLAGE